MDYLGPCSLVAVFAWGVCLVSEPTLYWPSCSIRLVELAERINWQSYLPTMCKHKILMHGTVSQIKLLNQSSAEGLDRNLEAILVVSTGTVIDPCCPDHQSVVGKQGLHTLKTSTTLSWVKPPWHIHIGTIRGDIYKCLQSHTECNCYVITEGETHTSTHTLQQLMQQHKWSEWETPPRQPHTVLVETSNKNIHKKWKNMNTINT